MLRQIQVTYSNREKRPINKVKRKDIIGSNNIEIADKIVYENVYSTTFRSRSRIESTEREFKFVRFNNNKRC